MGAICNEIFVIFNIKSSEKFKSLFSPLPQSKNLLKIKSWLRDTFLLVAGAYLVFPANIYLFKVNKKH